MKPSDLFRKIHTARRLSPEKRTFVARERTKGLLGQVGLSFKEPRPDYDGDAMKLWGRNLSFLKESRFQQAYGAGMDSGHHIGRAPGEHDDIHIEWRVETILWAASHALHLEGDFVECGVNTGMYPLAIYDYHDFESSGKRFYLFDTYDGIPVEQTSEREKQLGREKENEENYSDCFEMVKRNFAPFPSAQIVRGRVPDTLNDVAIGEVSFLSIDMNIVEPEIAALRYFWPRLVPGGIVVFDDYGWANFEAQQEAMDNFAKSVGCKILSLPSGQGVLIKP